MTGRARFPSLLRRAAAVVLSVVAVAATSAEDKALLNVVLNSVDRGDYFLLLGDGGDVLFPADKLPELGLRLASGVGTVVGGYLSLRSLQPELAFTLDEEAARIVLTVDPRLLEKQTIDLGRRKSPDTVHLSDDAFVLNYSIDYDGPQESTSLPFGITARLGKLLFLSDFGLTTPEPRFVRHSSSMVIDGLSSRVRFVAGDFVSSSGGFGLGGSGMFGGVSLSRGFFLDPFLELSPPVTVSGDVELPSTVTIYANGVKVAERKLSPGEFDFLHVPVPSGAVELAYIITDASGHETKVEYPMYHSTALLAPGLHEFSYSLGFRRQDPGTEIFSYDSEPVFLGTHRVGLTNWLTAGLRAEVAPEVINSGPVVTLTVGTAGDLTMAAAASYAGGLYGYGALLRYSFAAPNVGLVASARHLSESYANLNFAPEDEKQRFQGTVGLGVHQKLLGSLSASLGYDLAYDGTDSKTLQAFYSRQIAGPVTLRSIFAGTLEAGQLSYQTDFGLQLATGKIAAGLTYRFDDGLSAFGLDVQRSLSRGTGLGFRLHAGVFQQDASAWSYSVDVSVDVNLSTGKYTGTLGYREEDKSIDYGARAAGSVALVDRSLFLSRPIMDGFALAQVDRLRGIRVKNANEVVGRTNAAGRLLVPGLVSYVENELSVEQADLPLNYEIASLKLRVSPAYRSGGVADFRVTRFQAVTGKVFFVQDGVRTAAEYSGVEVQVGDRLVSSVVGVEGEFYLENLPTGQYRVRLFAEGREGTFTLDVPASEEIVVDVGEIDCAVEAKEEAP